MSGKMGGSTWFLADFYFNWLLKLDQNLKRVHLNNNLSIHTSGEVWTKMSVQFYDQLMKQPSSIFYGTSMYVLVEVISTF